MSVTGNKRKAFLKKLEEYFGHNFSDVKRDYSINNTAYLHLILLTFGYLSEGLSQHFLTTKTKLRAFQTETADEEFQTASVEMVKGYCTLLTERNEISDDKKNTECLINCLFFDFKKFSRRVEKKMGGGNIKEKKLIPQMQLFTLLNLMEYLITENCLKVLHSDIRSEISDFFKSINIMCKVLLYLLYSSEFNLMQMFSMNWDGTVRGKSGIVKDIIKSFLVEPSYLPRKYNENEKDPMSKWRFLSGEDTSFSKGKIDFKSEGKKGKWPLIQYNWWTSSNIPEGYKMGLGDLKKRAVKAHEDMVTSMHGYDPSEMGLQAGYQMADIIFLHGDYEDPCVNTLMAKKGDLNFVLRKHGMLRRLIEKGKTTCVYKKNLFNWKDNFYLLVHEKMVNALIAFCDKYFTIYQKIYENVISNQTVCFNPLLIKSLNSFPLITDVDTKEWRVKKIEGIESDIDNIYKDIDRALGLNTKSEEFVHFDFKESRLKAEFDKFINNLGKPAPLTPENLEKHEQSVDKGSSGMYEEEKGSNIRDKDRRSITDSAGMHVKCPPVVKTSRNGKRSDSISTKYYSFLSESKDEGNSADGCANRILEEIGVTSKLSKSIREDFFEEFVVTASDFLREPPTTDPSALGIVKPKNADVIKKYISDNLGKDKLKYINDLHGRESEFSLVDSNTLVLLLTVCWSGLTDTTNSIKDIRRYIDVDKLREASNNIGEKTGLRRNWRHADYKFFMIRWISYKQNMKPAYLKKSFKLACKDYAFSRMSSLGTEKYGKICDAIEQNSKILILNAFKMKRSKYSIGDSKSFKWYKKVSELKIKMLKKVVKEI